MSKQVFYIKQRKVLEDTERSYCATKVYVPATEKDFREAGYVKREKVKVDKINDHVGWCKCGNPMIRGRNYCPDCGSELDWEGE